MSATDASSVGRPNTVPVVAAPQLRPRRAISNIAAQPAENNSVWTAQRATSGQSRRATMCNAATTVAATTASAASDDGRNASAGSDTGTDSADSPSAQLPHRPAPTQQTLANNQTSTVRRSRERMRRSEQPSRATVDTPSNAIRAQAGQAREADTTNSGK